MDISTLTRTRLPAHPPLRVLDEVTLETGRLHEFCGTSRHLLALLAAAATEGPVLWIAPDWSAERLNPDGMAALVGPERFIFVSPKHPVDLLWTLEESLRSGAVALAIAELPELPGLTPVRRLHLAAETGAALGHGAPLGLILTPGDGGAPGVESRWHLAARHGARDKRAWALSRLRARGLPPATWTMQRQKSRFHLSPAEGTVCQAV
ncbi:MAG: hypothetical protein AAF678_09855 [Pseudomonadota bacterium]